MLFGVPVISSYMIVSYKSYPLVGTISFLYTIVPLAISFLHVFIPVFIEAKYYLVDLRESNGIVSIKYLRYNKEMIFEERKELVKFKMTEMQRQGAYFNESVVVGVRTKTSFFKKKIRFYEIAPWRRESLEKTFRDILK